MLGSPPRDPESTVVTMLQLVVLALIQGVTEFLPISSSGHLALVAPLTGWQDQGILIDVAVHGGTLAAVIVYFWRDLMKILTGLGERGSQSTRPLLGMLILATLPAGAAGYALHAIDPELFRDPAIIAWTTIGFGILLWAADRFGMTVRRIEHMTWGSALIIGLAQVLALVPGTSRSGITMTAARVLGFEREAAARFSLLLSIPLIGAAALLAVLDLREAGDAVLSQEAAIAAVLSFLAALVSIWAMLAWLRRASFTPFAIYRVILGLALLYWIYA